MADETFPTSVPQPEDGAKGIRAVIDKAVRSFKAVDARLVSAAFDKPPTNDRCPECGGTDLFDGEGTCQICQPM